MTKSILINLTSLLILLTVSLAYISFVADRVPPESATVVNVILVPMLLGGLSLLLVRGPFYIAVAILAIVAIVHAVYLGGDAAKPGLERFVALIEFVFFVLGLTIAYFGRRYLSTRY
jgi:hypothetical protein